MVRRRSAKPLFAGSIPVAAFMSKRSQVKPWTEEAGRNLAKAVARSLAENILPEAQDKGYVKDIEVGGKLTPENVKRINDLSEQMSEEDKKLWEPRRCPICERKRREREENERLLRDGS